MERAEKVFNDRTRMPDLVDTEKVAKLATMLMEPTTAVEPYPPVDTVVGLQSGEFTTSKWNVSLRTNRANIAELRALGLSNWDCDERPICELQYNQELFFTKRRYWVDPMWVPLTRDQIRLENFLRLVNACMMAMSIPKVRVTHMPGEARAAEKLNARIQLSWNAFDMHFVGLDERIDLQEIPFVCDHPTGLSEFNSEQFPNAMLTFSWCEGPGRCDGNCQWGDTPEAKFWLCPQCTAIVYPGVMNMHMLGWVVADHQHGLNGSGITQNFSYGRQCCGDGSLYHIDLQLDHGEALEKCP